MAEHLIFSRPILSDILSKLFNLMLSFRHVPHGFKVSYIVPVPKRNRLLFQSLKMWWLSWYRHKSYFAESIRILFSRQMSIIFSSRDNQFGFKSWVISCSNAVYSARKIIDRYIASGTTANLCAIIDLSKAFVISQYRHHALYIKLMNRQLLDMIFWMLLMHQMG